MPTLSTVNEVLAFLKRQQLVPLTKVDGFRSLVDLIAGEEVRGSWWGHPKGNAIYAIAEGLDDSHQVLSLKFLSGKVTFVDRSLWPSLFRVVTDRRYRAREKTKLSPNALRLLEQIPARGQMRVARDDGDAKDEIERSLLAHATQVHTEKGAHATVLQRWMDWAPPDVVKQADTLDFQSAFATLKNACRGVTSPLEREV